MDFESLYDTGMVLVSKRGKSERGYWEALVEGWKREAKVRGHGNRAVVNQAGSFLYVDCNLYSEVKG